MMIGARVGAWAKSGAPLPYDAEVEWIESTTGQYIDTLKSLFDGDVSIRFSLTALGGDRTHFGYQIYGSWKGSSVSGLTAAFAVRQYNNKFRIAYGDGTLKLTDIDVDNSIHTISTIDKKIYFDGVPLGINATVTTTESDVVDTITLCGFRYNGLIVNGSGMTRTYSCSIGNSLSLIPVRFTNENGVSEGAMYDSVSGKLFRNVGTGAFIVGPDK